MENYLIFLKHGIVMHVMGLKNGRGSRYLQERIQDVKQEFTVQYYKCYVE
jgi:hypothetical protein